MEWRNGIKFLKPAAKKSLIYETGLNKRRALYNAALQYLLVDVVLYF